MFKFEIDEIVSFKGGNIKHGTITGRKDSKDGVNMYDIAVSLDDKSHITVSFIEEKWLIKEGADNA